MHLECPLPMWMHLMFLVRRAHSSHHVWEHTIDMTYSLEVSSDHLAGGGEGVGGGGVWGGKGHGRAVLVEFLHCKVPLWLFLLLLI